LLALDLQVESSGVVSIELLSVKRSRLGSLHAVSRHGRILILNLELGGKDIRKGAGANVFVLTRPYTHTRRVEVFFVLCRVQGGASALLDSITWINC